MDIPVKVHFERDVLATITTEHICQALEKHSSESDVNTMLNSVIVVLKAIPDSGIAGLTKQRKFGINAFLVEQARRFAGEK